MGSVLKELIGDSIASDILAELRAGPADAHPASADGGFRMTQRVRRLTIAAAVIVGLAPLVLALCSLLHPSRATHDTALFVHLASLLVGFGGVLAVDWVALLFMAGRRTFPEMLRAADNAGVPIWLGYVGLVTSGLLLEPNLGSPMTQLKLMLVLVIGLNGVVVAGVHGMLRRGPALGWMVLGGACATLSQVAWWGATVIGFLNAR